MPHLARSTILLLLSLTSLTSVTALPAPPRLSGSNGGSQDKSDTGDEMLVEEEAEIDSTSEQQQQPYSNFANLVDEGLGGYGGGNNHNQGGGMLEEIVEEGRQSASGVSEAATVSGDYEPIEGGYYIDEQDFFEDAEVARPPGDEAPTSLLNPATTVMETEEVIQDPPPLGLVRSQGQGGPGPQAGAQAGTQTEAQPEVEIVTEKKETKEFKPPKRPERLWPSRRTGTFIVPADQRTLPEGSTGFMDPAPLDFSRYHGYFEPADNGQRGNTDINIDDDSDGSELGLPEDFGWQEEEAARRALRQAKEDEERARIEFEEQEAYAQQLQQEELGQEGYLGNTRNYPPAKRRSRNKGGRNGGRGGAQGQRKRPVRMDYTDLENHLRNLAGNLNFGGMNYPPPAPGGSDAMSGNSRSGMMSNFDQAFPEPPRYRSGINRAQPSFLTNGRGTNRAGNRIFARPSQNQGPPRQGTQSYFSNPNTNEMTPAEIMELFAMQYEQQQQQQQPSTQSTQKQSQNTLTVPSNNLNFGGDLFSFGSMPQTGGNLLDFDINGAINNLSGQGSNPFDMFTLPSVEKMQPTLSEQQGMAQQAYSNPGNNVSTMSQDQIVNFLLDRDVPIMDDNGLLPLNELRGLVRDILNYEQNSAL
ncbi:hypothetical protein ABW20_dc0107085 [Dactylellina cionopaga]|nr:hypothetical protein ABW20_dc0107085 [Dactylellina cionopaga]